MSRQKRHCLFGEWTWNGPLSSHQGRSMTRLLVHAERAGTILASSVKTGATVDTYPSRLSFFLIFGLSEGVQL